MRTTFVSAAAAALVLSSAGLAAASDVDVAVVDVTAPVSAVTLAPGGEGAITLNMSVTGNQAGTATFEVYREWLLENGVFHGSNPQEFTVAPRVGGDPATTFSTTGKVTVAEDEADATYTLAVGAFDITNSNASGGKLAAGDASSYAVTVVTPQVSNTAPVVTVTSAPDSPVEGNTLGGATVTWAVAAVDVEDDPDPAVVCTEGDDVVSSGSSVFSVGHHTVTCTATDSGGMSDTDAFEIEVVDTTQPTITVPESISVNATSNSQAVVQWDADEITATDIVDGPLSATCDRDSGSVFSVGTTTVTCSARDAAANTGAGQFTVTVKYDFDGFFKPVVNEGLNGVKAGSAVPIKFRLGGAQGLDVFAAGFPRSLLAAEDDADLNWDDESQVNLIATTLTAGSSQLQYDELTGTYTYVWKTEKSWAGTQRRLVIRFADGETRRLTFEFKK